MALTKVTGNLIAGGNGSLVDADTVDGLNVSSTNVVSTIVLRNSSGDFATRNIAAQDVTLSGNLTVTGITTTRNGSITTNTTITPTASIVDTYEVTALATATTIAIPSGTPQANQRLLLKIKDNGTAQAITWTTTAGGYRAVEVTLPTITVVNKVLYIGCIYNQTDGYWDVLALGQL